MLKANLDVQCEGRLVYPGGLNKIVGYAQWDNATVKVNISQDGTIFKFVMQSGNTSTQYIHTNYIGSFQSSTWIINTALKIILDGLNKEIFDKLAIDIQKELSLGIFNFNNTHIGYNDGFVSLGISIDFTGNVLTSSIAPQYLVNYLQSSTAEALTDYEGLPPVAPHVQAMMDESERQYLAHIS